MLKPQPYIQCLNKAKFKRSTCCQTTVRWITRILDTGILAKNTLIKKMNAKAVFNKIFIL